MQKLSQLISLVQASPRWAIIILISLAYIAKVIAFGETNADRAWNKGDAFFYHFMGQSILEDGDMDLTNNHGPVPLNDGQFAQSKFGYPTAKQSPLMTVMALPFRLVLGPVGALWFNILCSLGIVLLLYELLSIWVASIPAAFASLMVGLASVLFRYAFNFSPDVFSTILLLGLILASFRQKWYWVGLLTGAAISAKIGNIIVVGPILLHVLWQCMGIPTKEVFKILIKTGLLAILTILPFLIYNYWLFGSPLITGYQAILTTDTQGLPSVVSHTDDFNLPLISGLTSLLFNGRNGIIIDNWIIILPFLVGFFFVPQKQRSKLILLLAIVLIQLVFYSKYDHQLASSLGNRFLLLSIALMALPISWVAQALWNKLNWLSPQDQKSRLKSL